MPADRLRVAVPRRLPETAKTRVRAPVAVDIRTADAAMTRAELVQAMALIDSLVPSISAGIDAHRLALMKPQAVIVNTVRGDVIDENALVPAPKAGAALGVFQHGQPVTLDLRDLPGVVLLPHRASATGEGRVETGEKVLVTINTFADGHRPPNLAVPVPA